MIFSVSNGVRRSSKIAIFLLKTLDICIKKAEDALTGQGDMSGDELVFISKIEVYVGQ